MLRYNRGFDSEIVSHFVMKKEREGGHESRFSQIIDLRCGSDALKRKMYTSRSILVHLSLSRKEKKTRDAASLALCERGKRERRACMSARRTRVTDACRLRLAQGWGKTKQHKRRKGVRRDGGLNSHPDECSLPLYMAASGVYGWVCVCMQ